MGDKHPFVADAIIANPVSFAHVHIAERLGIPLHMMFTFPFTPTSMFPHPLANIKRSNVDVSYTNFMSYPLVEMMTWQGLGDLVNRFRVKTLGLEPVSTLWAPGQLYRLKVPYTYMWSPALVPKPPDWGPEIDICGFVFLELASSFKPPEELTKFLEAGEKPIYIGFGSIVVDDPDAFTHMIFEAVKEAGVRALVSKGWGGIGGEKGDLPDNIYLLDNTPHDWLFPRVRAVVHHGGAGTTAIGLKCAKPTMIVPFFGDQPFWGAMVAEKHAGAKKCVPYKKLNKDVLVEGIRDCLTDEAQEGVQKIADSIAREGDGAANAVKSFHRSLPLRGEKSMRCSVFEDRVAVWSLKKSDLRLSALAAELLVEKKKIKWSNLRLVRHYDWNDFDGPGEPVTGGGGALIGAVTSAAKGIGLTPVKMAQTVKKRKEHEEKKRRRSEKHARAVRSNSTGSNKGTSSDKDASNPSGTDRPPAQRTSTQLTRTTTQLSADPSEPLVEELAHEAGHGFKKNGRRYCQGAYGPLPCSRTGLPQCAAAVRRRHCQTSDSHLRLPFRPARRPRRVRIRHLRRLDGTSHAAIPRCQERRLATPTGWHRYGHRRLCAEGHRCVNRADRVLRQGHPHGGSEEAPAHQLHPHRPRDPGQKRPARPRAKPGREARSRGESPEGLADDARTPSSGKKAQGAHWLPERSPSPAQEASRLG